MKLENVTIENFSDFVYDVAVYSHVGKIGGDYYLSIDPEIATTFGLSVSVTLSYDNANAIVKSLKEVAPWASPTGSFSCIFRNALVTELVLRQLDRLNLEEVN